MGDVREPLPITSHGQKLPSTTHTRMPEASDLRYPNTNTTRSNFSSPVAKGYANCCPIGARQAGSWLIEPALGGREATAGDEAKYIAVDGCCWPGMANKFRLVVRLGLAVQTFTSASWMRPGEPVRSRGQEETRSRTYEVAVF